MLHTGRSTSEGRRRPIGQRVGQQVKVRRVTQAGRPAPRRRPFRHGAGQEGRAEGLPPGRTPDAGRGRRLRARRGAAGARPPESRTPPALAHLVALLKAAAVDDWPAGLALTSALACAGVSSRPARADRSSRVASSLRTSR